jgi:hypothetical protein
MEVKNFFRSMFSDETGEISAKRILGAICVLSLVVALMANVFSYGKMKPADNLVDAITMFAIGAFGLTSLDKFIKYYGNKKK